MNSDKVQRGEEEEDNSEEKQTNILSRDKVERGEDEEEDSEEEQTNILKTLFFSRFVRKI